MGVKKHLFGGTHPVKVERLDEDDSVLNFLGCVKVEVNENLAVVLSQLGMTSILVVDGVYGIDVDVMLGEEQVYQFYEVLLLSHDSRLLIADHYDLKVLAEIAHARNEANSDIKN